jgi:hypothetical protein
MTDDDLTLDHVTRMDHASVAGWVDRTVKGHRDAAAAFNWLGLAEVTRRNACSRRVVSEEERLAWADLTATALEMGKRFGQFSDDYAGPYEFALRCALIGLLGPRSNSSWVDPQRVLSDFRATLDLTPHEAEGMSGHWRDMPREEIMRLRRIKTRLTQMLPIRDTLEQRDGSAIADLDRWFSLLPHLP